MKKLIHILFAILLTFLSVVMVFLNFMQNRSYNADGTYAVSTIKSSDLSQAVSYRNKSGEVEYQSFKPSKGASSIKTASAPRMAFDYTVVSIKGNQIRSGSGYSGLQSYKVSYSRSVPESSRSSVSLPAYSGAVSPANTSANKTGYSMNTGSYKVRPFSRQNSNLQNDNSSSSDANHGGMFGSGMLAAAGQTRQAANAATLEDPLAPDPGGDPDPGEMIPVPDGLLVLLLAALLYVFYKSVFFRRRSI